MVLRHLMGVMEIIRITATNKNWHSVSLKDALRTFNSCIGLTAIESVYKLKQGETILVGEGRYKLAK